jgi:hypothetical protein
MPATVQDLTFYVSTALISSLVFAICVIVWRGFNKLDGKVDILISHDSDRRVETASIKTTLKDHIGNGGVHCKGMNCVMRLKQ